MADFIEAATLEQVPDGSMRGVKVEGKDILIVNFQGKYYAIGKKCTHLRGDLSKGKLDGKIVTCPWHGSQFDVTTGNAIKGPAKKNVPVYEVKVEGSSIKISM